MTKPRRRFATLGILAAAALATTAMVVPAVSAPATGTVTGKVTVIGTKGKPKKDHSKIVLSIEVKGHRAPKMRAQVRQKNKQFAPELTVVTRNSIVEFPNDDKIFHNVFSLSRAARFDLGLYKSGDSKSVKLRRDGVINVYCNIHPEMVSQIKVVDTPYFAVSGRDGTFRIDGVPVGTHSVRAWQPYGKEWTGTVTVKPNGTATLTLSMKAGRRPKGHLRKDGTPYGRYR